MEDNIAVSIICMAYNHEKYVKRALDSFIEQETNFHFEVLINDDCSVDGTVDIIKKYAKDYPNIIRAIFQKENQYSKGNSITRNILLPKAKGKYFVFCEGDDYFIDKNKLQKQYDYMERNKNCTLCIHNSIFVNERGDHISDYIVADKLPRIISCQEVIYGGGGFCATSSIMGRLSTVKKLPDYFDFLGYDYTWQIYLASLGETYCFDERMSAYRVFSAGSWSSNMLSNDKKQVEHIQKVIELRNLFNENTNFEYEDIIRRANLESQIEIYLNTGDYRKIFDKDHISAIFKMSFTKMVKTIIKICFPGIVKVIKRRRYRV